MKHFKRYTLTLGGAVLTTSGCILLDRSRPFLPVGVCFLLYTQLGGGIALTSTVCTVAKRQPRLLWLYHILTGVAMLTARIPFLFFLAYAVGAFFGLCCTALCIAAGETNRHLEVYAV